MDTTIYVSGDELETAAEKLALIGSGKSEETGVVKITARPWKDKRFLLKLHRFETTEQLIWRMDAKGDKDCIEPVSVTVDSRKFTALAKNMKGGDDIKLIFKENRLIIQISGGRYELMAQTTEVPELPPPEEGVDLNVSTDFLRGAYRHCKQTVSKKEKNAWSCIQLDLKADGSAAGWSTNMASMAKYSSRDSGCQKDATLVLPADSLRVITELAEESGSLRIVEGSSRISAATPRFDYTCLKIVARMPKFRETFAKYEAGMTKTIKVRRDLLLAAITRACTIAGDEYGYIELKSDDGDPAGSLYVEATSAVGQGTGTIPLEQCTGADNDANLFVAASLARLVSSCMGESIEIKTSGRLRPYIFSAAGSDSSYVLAPCNRR